MMMTATKPKRRDRRRPKPLAALLDDVLRHAGAELDDEEAVHDLRVACRRLEAGVRLNQGVLGKRRLRKLRDAAKSIRRAFDQARDLEVIAAEIASVSAVSDGFRQGVRDAARHREASSGARAAVGKEIEVVAQACAALTDGDLPEPESVATALREHIIALFETLSRLMPESTDHALHQARIETKRLRYEMEIAKPLFPRLSVTIGRLKRLQDIVGRHQDAAVGLEWAEKLAAGELGASPADRAALMRYYAALRRDQRRQLRRLNAAWQTHDMRGRFLAAVR